MLRTVLLFLLCQVILYAFCLTIFKQVNMDVDRRVFQKFEEISNLTFKKEEFKRFDEYVLPKKVVSTERIYSYFNSKQIEAPDEVYCEQHTKGQWNCSIVTPYEYDIIEAVVVCQIADSITIFPPFLIRSSEGDNDHRVNTDLCGLSLEVKEKVKEEEKMLPVPCTTYFMCTVDGRNCVPNPKYVDFDDPVNRLQQVVNDCVNPNWSPYNCNGDRSTINADQMKSNEALHGYANICKENTFIWMQDPNEASLFRILLKETVTTHYNIYYEDTCATDVFKEKLKAAEMLVRQCNVNTDVDHPRAREYIELFKILAGYNIGAYGPVKRVDTCSVKTGTCKSTNFTEVANEYIDSILKEAEYHARTPPPPQPKGKPPIAFSFLFDILAGILLMLGAHQRNDLNMPIYFYGAYVFVRALYALTLF